jgi:hypothetical protein
MLKQKQQDTLDKIIEMFPEISTTGFITRKQVVAFVETTSSNWPTFITLQTPVSRGCYPIPGQIVDDKSISLTNQFEQPVQQVSMVAITSNKEKQATKRRELIQKTQAASGMIKGSSFEPTTSPMSYSLDLIKALNYYNSTYDIKDKIKWTLDYISDKNQKKILSSVPDHEFHSIGALIRLKTRNQFLEDRELNRIDLEIKRLLGIGYSLKKHDESSEVTAKVSFHQENSLSDAEKIAADFDSMIDDFIKDNKVPDFSEYLKNNSVSTRTSNKIPELFSSTIGEIQEALSGTDNDLIEGYSNFTRPRLKKLLTVYQSIEEACNKQKIVARITRKPRKQREKPVSKIIEKVKYQKEDEQLKLKSELPSKLVGATEVWLYNTRYKKLQVYKVAEPSKMTIKGTTLIGWDHESSKCKTIRKPEQLVSYQSMGKREIAKAFKDLKSKEQAVTGRLNEQTIILKVF